jgi:hypothetical protein
MHAQPPRTLKRLLKQYGQELIDDPRRTEALLRDHCGQHTREIFVLVNAQKQRIPSELLAAPTWLPRQATYSRLSRLLQTKLAITEDAADWAVAAWAAALDLESMPKGDAWSWLPGQQRTPERSSGRKQRSKKRQNGASSVQYPKSQTRNVARKAKARSARAEMGWLFPVIDLWRMLQRIQLPAVWTNLLPWGALLVASIFLLAVVYWTSGTRDTRGLVNEAGDSTTPVAEQSNTNETESNVSTNASSVNVTALPDLPAPPGEYLDAVMPLPTWANVSDSAITLYVRAEPTLNSNVLDFLPAGEPVQVVDFSSDGRWSQIDRPRSGWISNDFLLFKSQDATQSSIQLRVQPRRTQRYEVTVRSAPTTNATEVTTLAPSEAVIVVATLGDPPTWYQIAEPTVGWIAANDLAAAAP